jgi:exonuclease III
MRFGTWNVGSLYSTRSLKTAARKYKIDLVCVQEERRQKGGLERAEDRVCFYGEGIENHQVRAGFFFVHNTTITAVRRV